MRLKLNKRHIAKTITWRVVGTLDTLVISWVVSGALETGVKIGLSELVTKMILYYAHERFWFSIKKLKKNKYRHLIKTFSWRFIGTLDTIVLGWLFTGSPTIGLKIGIIEVLSKMILYYAHEKLWYKLNFGLEKRTL